MGHSRFAVLLALGLVAAFAACSGDDDTGTATPGAGGPDAATGTSSGTTGSGSSSSGGGSSSSGGGSGPPQDGGNDGAPPGYDVKSLPGLVLWLESGTAVDLGGATPAKWSDQSGNANDAVQPGACGKPDRNANVLNGHQGLGFHELECLEIPDAVTLQWGTGDFYLAAVTRNFANTATSTDEGTTFTYQDGSYKRKRFGEVYSKIPSLFGPGPTIVFNDWTDRSRKIVGSLDVSQMVKTPNIYAEPAHIIALRRKGEVLELRIDGAVTSQMTDAGAPLDISTAGTPVAIGGRPGLTNFVGSIWEIVAIKGASADADLAKLEAYAIAKYKLPGPND
jgi:hypothetical protein